MNGHVTGYFSYFVDALWAPINYYYLNDYSPPSWLTTVINLWHQFWSWISNNIGTALCQVAGLCTFPDYAAAVAPVIHDLAEGSERIQALNSPGNLSRESGAIANRRYLFTAIWPEHGFFQFLFPDNWQDWASARNTSTSLYFALYDYYSGSANDMHWLHSTLWYDGAVALQNLDVNWLSLTGSLDPVGTHYECSPSAECHVVISSYPSDGLVDGRSAGFSAEFVVYAGQGISHSRQTKDAGVGRLLKDQLQSIGVPLRSTPYFPPSEPAPFSVQITGPGYVRPNSTCVWTVHASGGTTPYNGYSWNVGGAGPYIEYRVGTSGVALQVTVTDAAGTVKTASRAVTVSSTAPACMV